MRTLSLILFVCAFTAAAQNTEPLRQGLERLAENDTSGALATFEHASPRDAAAHYNAGTLALERDDLGPARFHLEAASRLVPFLTSISHNLALARNRVGIVSDGPDVFTKLWRWIASKIGLPGLILVTLGLYIAALILLRRQRNNSGLPNTLSTATVGLLAIVFLSFSVVALWKAQRPEGIVITDDEVSLYAIPNPDSPPRDSLQPGQLIRLLETEGPWAKIHNRDRALWVPERAVRRLPF